MKEHKLRGFSPMVDNHARRFSGLKPMMLQCHISLRLKLNESTYACHWVVIMMGLVNPHHEAGSF